MENTITLLPPLADLAPPARRQIKPISRLVEPRIVPLTKKNSSAKSVSIAYVNPRAERIYELATAAAVLVMTAALIMTFGIYLSSFAAR
jgi:hypothetical protein